MGQGAAGSLCEVAATGKQREKHEVLGLISAHGMQYSFTAPQSSLLTELDVTEESPAVTCMSSSLLPLIFGFAKSAQQTSADAFPTLQS